MLFYIWKQGALGLFNKLVRWFSTWDTHGLSFVVGICKQGDCSVTAVRPVIWSGLPFS